MLVILILLGSSCSSNWKLAYLNTPEPRSIDAFAGNAKTESEGNINISDEVKTEEEEFLDDTTYKADNLNERWEVNAEGELIGAHKDGIKLDAVFVRETKSVITPVDTSGRLIMSLTVEVPKDILSSDWQMRLHPRIFIRQNKIEAINFAIEDLYITGSNYRDRQIAGYERYSHFLSKIINGGEYNNTINLNNVLNKNISDHVNKYQIEYLIMRYFPEVFKLKNDSTYISDEEFASVLGIDKEKLISHYYNKSDEDRRNKLLAQKNTNFIEWVYNPLKTENVQTDNVVHREILDSFDEMYSEVLEKIKEDDTLKKRYYNYLEEIKENPKADFPHLKSEYFIYIDSINLAQEVKERERKNDSKNEKELKSNNLKFPGSRLNNLRTDKFKLDKFEVISGSDTSKIYMKYDYSTILNAFQYPNIDRVYIGITGDVYDDTTHIYNFKMRDRLEYPVTSTANLADTTEIVYDYKMVLRKANHGASYSIEFDKNSAALKENFRNNAKVISDIKTNLEALLKNAEFDLDSIIVSATASPEGAINVNQRYSGQRSDAVSNYFKNYIDSHKWKYKSRIDSLKKEIALNIQGHENSFIAGLIDEKLKDELIAEENSKLTEIKIPNIELITRPIAENWDDLYTLVSMDSVMSVKEKNQFYDTYENTKNVDARENAMKKHSYYNYMSKNLYPQIRVVKFDFHMHRKGMEHDTTWIPVPSEKYLEGVRALRGFDFVKAENILKHYPSYNAAICFIVRKKPIQAINLLEAPSMQIDYEYYKAKRDSLTKLYVSQDSTLLPLKDTIMQQINAAKERMDRAAKIEFLKAKAYVMRRSGEDDWSKALDSYLFLRRADKINGMYNVALTGEEDIRGAVFGSSQYFEYTAQTDEYLQYLPSVSTSRGNFKEIIDKYIEVITLQIKKEEVTYYNAEKMEAYLSERDAWSSMGYSEDIVDKIIFLGIDPPELEY